ncbi:MAG TPA: HAMP domain-containing sensor histidine kinase [Ktedonobacteraceae bacterium]|nr:HAMP domain-containing sensor histidine kinase [Ktedonobacteraceae bacterium]
MLARTYFHDVADRVRELSGCRAVLLVLNNPAIEPGRFLLQELPVNTHLFGALELADLLRDERVRALCDVACQSGQMRCINDGCFVAGALLARDVAIAPLECTSGLLGYVMLVDAMEGSFTPGDACLLNSYLPAIMPDIESHARMLNTTGNGSSGGRGVAAAMDGNTLRRVASDMKNDLIAMVSHELRAPLTAIKGYAGLLQAYSLNDCRQEQENESETTITSVRQQHYLDIIMDQASHLEILMGDLLDVSRIQAGKLALRYTEVDLASLCQQVVRLVWQRIDQPGQDRHTLRCEVSPDLPPLQTDANRLQQILHNLLDNAVKYSPDGGLIELRASLDTPAFSDDALRQQNETRPGVLITICDRGIGMSPQQRARLFQPFSRLDHPVASQVQGAGLGLYITQKLVEAMQGTIELTSQENKGTCVTVRLPLFQPGKVHLLHPVNELYGVHS